MSRLTSAQVIALGEYLQPDFEPATLTVPQLLGVFGYHNIRYPSPYTKAKLVQTFNQEIKPNASKFRREKLKKENSQASDDGIVDGVTGLPLTSSKQPAQLRRSSRHVSRSKSEDQSPPRPDPPKRRRSSAQPRLTGHTKVDASRPQQTIIEESESEQEQPPMRKVVRTRKASDAKTRRVSQWEDSGWEDNNIFQSGAESSSPLRPSPAKPRTRRTSAKPPSSSRISKKSASEPPQPPLQPSTSRSTVFDTMPESAFEPDIPVSPRVTRAARTSLIHQQEAEEQQFKPASYTIKGEESEVEEQPNPTEQSPEEFPSPAQGSVQLSSDVPEDVQELQRSVPAVPRRVAQGADALVVATKSKHKRPGLNLFVRFIGLVAIGLVSTFGYDYKVKSASIGFCDTGKNTSSALVAARERHAAMKECNFEHRPKLWADDREDNPDCPLPIFSPDSCTPCPGHSTCTQHTVTCDTGYLIRPHPLLSFLPRPSTATSMSWSFPEQWEPDYPSDYVWKAIGMAVSGLPGFGPVAFPPRCVEDPKRKRHIGALGKAIETLLAQERGRKLCSGMRPKEVKVDGEDVQLIEARTWGVSLDNLKGLLREKTAPHLLETFDDTFNEAVQQLVQWGSVILGEDSNGSRYLAHETPNMTWDCVLTVKARETWSQHQRTVFLLITSFVAYLFNRSRRARKQIENRRVAELVEVVLDILRNREMQHHTDPVLAPTAYVSSLGLRDQVMHGESLYPARKERLWERVESIVEGNVNVRTNIEEVSGGHETRVWQWVGGA
ncbi:Man1-Src1p-C-terminal domain-containing protein [Thelephora terrestris]|uniref:Man1-Src1p-C-terminal domain-containing protein n=1 Tax=Thelephora terrestris TaxID=56493 RepID=A0A9P6HR80_9AGAM|nr:Man1-Src1p-C-terminal domain-containing protein [Thelephora terrestris]